MFHLTTSALDAWARANSEPGGWKHTTLVRLDEGDVLSYLSDPTVDNSFVGPAIVELTVYRDGGWSAREMAYETPESIIDAAFRVSRR